MATITPTPVLGGQRHMTPSGLSLAAGIAFPHKTVVRMSPLGSCVLNMGTFGCRVLPGELLSGR